jgi:hypothetical protein
MVRPVTVGEWTVYAGQDVDAHHPSGLIVRLYRRGGDADYFNVPQDMSASVRDRLAKQAENALIGEFGIYPDDM